MKYHIKFTEGDYKRSQKYIHDRIKQLNVPLNKRLDANMIEWLDNIAERTGETKGGYIKRLIREDMERDGNQLGCSELKW